MTIIEVLGYFANFNVSRQGTIYISDAFLGKNNAYLSVNHGRHPVSCERLEVVLWSEDHVTHSIFVSVRLSLFSSVYE